MGTCPRCRAHCCLRLRHHRHGHGRCLRTLARHSACLPPPLRYMPWWGPSRAQPPGHSRLAPVHHCSSSRGRAAQRHGPVCLMRMGALARPGSPHAWQARRRRPPRSRRPLRHLSRGFGSARGSGRRARARPHGVAVRRRRRHAAAARAMAGARLLDGSRGAGLCCSPTASCCTCATAHPR